MKLFGGEASSFPNACALSGRDSLLWGRSKTHSSKEKLRKMNHPPLLTFNYGSDTPQKSPASVKSVTVKQGG